MKIGDASSVTPSGPSGDDYSQDLLNSAQKFQDAFDNYQFAQTSEEKQQYQAMMSQQLAMMNAACRELKRSGLAKQESILEKDYRAYMTNPSDENLAAVQHDLVTLQDYVTENSQ